MKLNAQQVKNVREHLCGLENALGLPKAKTAEAVERLAAPETPGFYIAELDHDDVAFIVAPIQYRGAPHLVEVGRGFVNGGKERPLKEHYRLLKKSGSRLLPPDGHLFWGTIDTLYEHREGAFKREIAGCNKVLGDAIRDYWVRLGSDLIYRPVGKDVVVHNPGTPLEWRVDRMLTGPDGFVTETKGADNYCFATLGTGDVKRVNTVFKALTGVPAYVYRLNEPPALGKPDITRAFGVLAIGGGCYLSGGSVGNFAPAFGWQARKISTGNQGRK